LGSSSSVTSAVSATGLPTLAEATGAIVTEGG
jgi:hypothetical protein